MRSIDPTVHNYFRSHHNLSCKYLDSVFLDTWIIDPDILPKVFHHVRAEAMHKYVLNIFITFKPQRATINT